MPEAKQPLQPAADSERSAGRTHLPILFFLVAAALLLATILYLWYGNTTGATPPEQAQILYLNWDEQDAPQLYAASLSGEPPRALTDAGMGLAGYAVAPDGSAIAYTTNAGAGGNSVWVVDRNGGNARQILNCAGTVCAGLVWVPDGRRLVYERHELPANGAGQGQSELWWLEPATGETRPVFAAEHASAVSAGFSANGHWLSAVLPDEEVTRLHNLETGDSVSIPNEVAAAPAWHPADERLVSANIEYQGEQFAVHLYHVAVQDGVMTPISDQMETDDGSPAWSPDGRQLAFGRRIPRAHIGRQIWVMEADGSQSRQLTSDPESNFGPPRWSPDGHWLLVQRYLINQPADRPSIWLLEVDGGELRQAAPAGFAPAWLP